MTRHTEYRQAEPSLRAPMRNRNPRASDVGKHISEVTVMALENPLIHPQGSGTGTGTAARANGQELLAWNPPVGSASAWLYHAPLLFSLLQQIGPANVLVICDADSRLPDLLKSLPDTLAPEISTATVLLDNAKDAPAADNPTTKPPSDPRTDQLTARLASFPDSVFQLVLIDLPLTEALIATVQGEALARIAIPDAVVALHGAERTPAGAQLVTTIRLTQPHLSAHDGDGLILFPTGAEPPAMHAIGDRMGFFRALGRAYHSLATERDQRQTDAAAHQKAIDALQQRQSLYEDTNRAQTSQLLELSAKISDSSRAIAALPLDADPASFAATRAVFDGLQGAAHQGAAVPAGLTRLLTIIETLQARLAEAQSQKDATIEDGRAILTKLRAREAELLKNGHTIERMTKELAALAVQAKSSADELVTLRKTAAQKTKLDAEYGNLQKVAAKAQADNRTLQKQLASRDAQIDAVLHSTSWRITSPVRAAGKVLRRRG